MEDFTDILRDRGACCCCNETMKNSKHINLVNTQMPATWDFPRWGNFLTGEKNKAVAVVCDKCIEETLQLKFVIELNEGKIIYHSFQQPQKNSPA